MSAFSFKQYSKRHLLSFYFLLLSKETHLNVGFYQ